MNFPLLLLGHFLADFATQSDEIACTKSKNFSSLFQHCLLYATLMVIFTQPSNQDILLILTTYFVSHFCIDGITSRITSYFWSKEQRHNFFVTIGADQMLHMYIIWWIYNGFANIF